MRFLAAAIALTTVLAGCSTTPDVPTDVEDTVENLRAWVLGRNGTLEDWPGDFPALEQLIITDRISGEPTIGVTRTGAVFYASIDFDVQVPGATALPSTVYYRSTDGGETWVDASPAIASVKTHPTSFDPYVYADPMTGRIYALDMGPHVACNKVSWSDDDGETWITRDGACPLPVADHPTLFAGPRPVAGGSESALYPNNLYLCTNQLVDVQCSLSPDGGMTWLPSQPVYTECGGLVGHGHASWADGTVYVPRLTCGVPEVAVSHDGGLTYQVVRIISQEKYHGPGHEAVVSTDREGNAYYFWIGDEARTAWLAVSHDQGRSWGDPINVTAPGVTAAKLPSIVAGDEGRIAFLYIGTTTPSGMAVHAEENEAERRNATWNAYVTFGQDVHTDDPVFAVTMAHNATEPMKRGGCSGRCFGDHGGMYDFLDIDMDPISGQVWVALVDVCTGGCDEEGADGDTEQISKGSVARQVAGSTLLSDPVATSSGWRR